jgi:hypothetical protein
MEFVATSRAQENAKPSAGGGTATERAKRGARTAISPASGPAEKADTPILRLGRFERRQDTISLQLVLSMNGLLGGIDEAAT